MVVGRMAESEGGSSKSQGAEMSWGIEWFRKKVIWECIW